MMLMLAGIEIRNLVAAAAVSELHLLQKPQLDEKLQAAIDSSQADFRMIGAQDHVHVLRADMLARTIHENLQNDLPLRRHLALCRLQTLLQVFHGICLCHISSPSIHQVGHNVLSQSMRIVYHSAQVFTIVYEDKVL